MKRRTSSLLSILLTLSMVLALLPVNAWAADPFMASQTQAELQAYVASAASYTAPEPKVTSFTVAYGGKEPVEILNGSPLLSDAKGAELTFTVTFERPDLVDKVYIAGTSGQTMKYIDAELEDGVYVAKGKFNADGSLPETVSVRYSRKQIPVSESETINAVGISMQDEKTALADQGVTVENIIENEEGVTAQIVLKAAGDAAKDKFVDALISEYVPVAGEAEDALNKWLKLKNGVEDLTRYGLEGQIEIWVGEVKDTVTEGLKDPTTSALILIRDGSTNKYTKMVIQAFNDSRLNIDRVPIDFAVDALPVVKTAASSVLEVYANQKEMNALREEIKAKPGLTTTQRADALEKIDALEKDKNLFLAGTTLIPLFVGLTVASGGTAGILFSGMLGVYSAVSGYFWDYRVGQIRGTKELAPFQSEHPGWYPLGIANPDGEYMDGYYYIANPDGAFSLPQDDIVTVCLHGAASGFTVPNGTTMYLQDCKYIENLDGTLVDGYGTTGVTMFPGSKLIVDDAYITGISGYYTCTGADITIKNGTVNSINDNGNNFNITFNDGTLGYVSMSSSKETTGTITINGGTVTGRLGINDSKTNQKDFVINDGIFNGTICPGVGNLTINGGVFKDRVIKAFAEGAVVINGGTFNACVTNTVYAPMRISNGTFSEIYAYAYDAASEPITTLAINSKSDITVKQGLNIHSMNYAQAVAVVPDGSYTGGVTYYSSATDEGTYMTLEEAEAQIKKKPNAYFRLKGGDVTFTDGITFTDVAADAYYYDAVQWAVENSITSGTSGTTFSPDNPCTRAQIVTFLYRAAGSPAVTADSSFTDVKAGEYYTNAVAWAVANGITSGTGTNTFSPNEACTRAQAVTFLYRAKKSPAVSGTNNFTDVDSGAYYANAVQWAVNTGVTSGTGSTTFSPDQTCTRGQIVTFLYRDNSGSYYPQYTGDSISLVAALDEMGIDISYSNRQKIATANGIADYEGNEVQNKLMLDLLKAGKLLRA